MYLVGFNELLRWFSQVDKRAANRRHFVCLQLAHQNKCKSSSDVHTVFSHHSMVWEKDLTTISTSRLCCSISSLKVQFLLLWSETGICLQYRIGSEIPWNFQRILLQNGLPNISHHAHRIPSCLSWLFLNLESKWHLFQALENKRVSGTFCNPNKFVSSASLTKNG